MHFSGFLSPAMILHIFKQSSDNDKTQTSQGWKIWLIESFLQSYSFLLHIIASDLETDSSSKCLSCWAFRQVSHGAAVTIFPWIFWFSLACVGLNILTKCSLIWISLFMFSPQQRETYKRSPFDEIACVSYQAVQTHTCPNCSQTRGPCSHRRPRNHCSLCLWDTELHYTQLPTSDTKQH